MLNPLMELSRTLDANRCAAFALKRSRSLLIKFNSRRVVDVELMPYDSSGFVSPIMCAAPQPRSPNGPGSVAPGSGKLKQFASLQKGGGTAKIDRTFEILRAASKDLKLREIKDLMRLMEKLLQSDSKELQHLKKLLDRNIPGENHAEMSTVFCHQNPEAERPEYMPLFTYRMHDYSMPLLHALAEDPETPEAAWWQDRFVNEVKLFCCQGLRGICSVTLQEDDIAATHHGLPSNPKISKTPAGLCTRNKSWAKDDAYEQSEPSRIGVHAMVYTMSMLQLLIKNQLAFDGMEIPTCFREEVAPPSQPQSPSCVNHHINWTDGLVPELQAVLSMMFDGSKQQDEAKITPRTAAKHNYIENQFKRLINHKIDLSDNVYDGFLHSVCITERQARAKVSRYEMIPIRKAFQNIESWFNDLHIKDGQIDRNRLAFWQIERVIGGSVRRGYLFDAALHKKALPTQYIRRVLSNMPNHFVTSSKKSDQWKEGKYQNQSFYKFKVVPSIALIRQSMIRSGINVDEYGYIDEPTDRAFLLGALFGRFDQHLQNCLEETNREGQTKKFFSQVKSFMMNPATSIPRLWRQFCVYNQKINLNDRVATANCRAKWINMVRQPTLFLTKDDFGPISTMYEKQMFWLGWFSSRKIGRWNEKYGEFKRQGESDPTGRMLANYYKHYLTFCNEQENRDIFLQKFIFPALTNPTVTLAHLRNRFPEIYIRPKKGPYCPPRKEGEKSEPKFIRKRKELRELHDKLLKDDTVTPQHEIICGFLRSFHREKHLSQTV